MYGICEIQEVETNYRRINRLKCKCGEQYTGKFCDSKLNFLQLLNRIFSVRISRFWIYELLMYSPIGGHFLFMGLFFFFFIFWIQRSSAAKITIVDDVPDFENSEVDMGYLYLSAMDEVDLEEVQVQKDTDQEYSMSKKFHNVQLDSV